MKRFIKNLFTKTRKLPVDEQISKKTFISFLVFGAIQATGIIGWLKLKDQPLDGGLRGGIQEPLRKGLDLNEKIFGNTFSSGALAKEYPVSEAVNKARVN